jgi:hypothetical protein
MLPERAPGITPGASLCRVDAERSERIVQMRATTARQRGEPRRLAEQGS